MVLFFRIIFRKIKAIIWHLIDKLILLFPIYYTDLNKISVFKWFSVIEGNKNELFKFKIFNHIPYKFDEIILDMMFQSENLNLNPIQKRADLAILQSLAARTENKSMKFQADVLAKEIENEEKNNQNAKTMTLNEFIDYIEITFNQINSIDIHKTSAGRCFSLFNKAVERNKQLSEQYNKTSF